MPINKIIIQVSRGSQYVNAMLDANYTTLLNPDAVDRAFDTTDPKYQTFLTAYNRADSPAQLVFNAGGREFAESVAAFEAQPAGGTLERPRDWMLLLHPFYLQPQPSAPVAAGSPATLDDLVYGNFSDLAAAQANPPAVSVDSTTHQFTVLTSGWSLFASDPAAGEERFAVAVSAVLSAGGYVSRVSAVYQETNSNLGVRYSVDGVSGWSRTRAPEHAYFEVHIGTGWGPPIRFGFGSINQRTTFLTTPVFSSGSATESSPLYMSALFTPGLYHTMIWSCFTYGGGAVQSLDEVRFSPGLIKVRPDLTSQGQSANTMLVSRAADRQWGVSLAGTAGTGSIIGRAFCNWDINAAGQVTRLAVAGVYPNNAAFKLSLSGIRK